MIVRDPCLSRVDGVMISFYWCYLENGELRTKKIALDQWIVMVKTDDDNDEDNNADGNGNDDLLWDPFPIGSVIKNNSLPLSFLINDDSS